MSTNPLVVFCGMGYALRFYLEGKKNVHWDKISLHYSANSPMARMSSSLCMSLAYSNFRWEMVGSKLYKTTKPDAIVIRQHDGAMQKAMVVIISDYFNKKLASGRGACMPTAGTLSLSKKHSSYAAIRARRIWSAQLSVSKKGTGAAL